MPPAPLPIDENARLAALAGYAILDTAPDPRADVFVALSADIFDVPIALISLVDENRQWFKASVGVKATETPREMAFCAHAILDPAKVMVVEDAVLDPRFKDNALVTGELGIRFYAGAPILSADGFALGTLCVMDRTARALDEAGRRHLMALARGAASVLELHRTTTRLEHLAFHDPLTGLANRAMFEPRLLAAAEQAAKGGVGCALVCIDLDRFKLINDRFGHAGGDAVLRAAAARLQGSIRAEDLAGRLGGDEFVLLVSGVTDPAAMHAMGTRLIKALSAPISIGDEPAMIGASIGFALAPSDGFDGPALMRRADAALYRAKAAGRGTVVGYRDDPAPAVATSNTLLDDLRHATVDGSLMLHWQPYFDLRTGQACGQEALIRWCRPGHGPTPPDMFIPAAEDSGLILQIDAWVLQTACREAASWPEQQSVSVNVTPSTFCSINFAADVARVLAETGLAPHRLVLEITERSAIDRHSAAVLCFHALHQLGVRVALDDFGAGYATLACLQEFEFDTVKMDRSLINNISHSARARATLAGMIGLGRSIGMVICAEGIEDEHQLAFLRDSQCDMAQGFHLGRPGPSAVFKPLPMAPKPYLRVA